MAWASNPEEVLMSKLEFTIHCPVCHMTKINRSLLVNYRGVDHYCWCPSWWWIWAVTWCMGIFQCCNGEWACTDSFLVWSPGQLSPVCLVGWSLLYITGSRKENHQVCRPVLSHMIVLPAYCVNGTMIEFGKDPSIENRWLKTWIITIPRSYFWNRYSIK